MTQEVAARRVDVDGHVSLLSRQRSCTGDFRKVLSELLRVEGIAKGEKGRKELERGIIQAVKVGKVASLMDTVNVCFFGSKREILLDFRADRA